MPEQKIPLFDYRYEQEGQTTGASLSLLLDEQGSLQLAGVDFGPTTEAMMGDWDYEYWLTIDPKDQQKLLLALLQERFTTPGKEETVAKFNGISTFKEWLDQHGIKYQYQGY